MVIKIASKTAQGRKGYGYADSKTNDSKPKMQASGVYSSRRYGLLSSQTVKDLARLEKMLRNGKATPEEIEKLESLAYMLYEGPFGC